MDASLDTMKMTLRTPHTQQAPRGQGAGGIGQEVPREGLQPFPTMPCCLAALGPG